MEDLKIWLIIAQIINFSVLFFIFKYFLWDKIVKAIEERKLKLAKFAKIDSKIKEKLEESKKEAKKILKNAREESEEIIWEAEKIAKNKRASILEKAEQEAKWIIESGVVEVEKEKLSMLADVKSNIIDLVLRFNKKLFWSEKISSEFVEKEIELMK